MQTKTGNGIISEFMGKPVTPEIPYDFSYSVFENLAEAKQSDSWPSDSEILKWVNQTSERAAKAKSYTNALTDHRKAYEETREFKVAQLVKSLRLAGKDASEAQAIAESLVAA